MEIHNAHKRQREWFDEYGLTGHRPIYLLVAEFPGTKIIQFTRNCGAKYVASSGFPFSGDTAVYAELSEDDITALMLVFSPSDTLFGFKEDRVYVAKVVPEFTVIEKLSRWVKRLFNQKDLPWSFDK